ncbi:MAG: GNAT family N-acetyltransferase [Phenylobacterium sp.]|uniref:GNAT family N-acetyltransferase n=1 Tax=Phenylobacterium sp. TaxID=1871053 RepID=UPI001A3C92B8|nr:GNAT family N-acetyltransferase [Phenylobacterium sp.]MBL8555861.1 GNAT family N-acetyltransferase [Phenylobacterium sp.]
MIETERLILRPFRDDDCAPFAAINGDPRVGGWLGGPFTREQSDATVDRINAQVAADGFGFYAAEQKADGALVGMIGIRRNPAGGPAPAAVELGWRLAVAAQGTGLATEGAKACLDWGFANLDVAEILAWTAASNVRSQAVMRRIGMTPDPSRDFIHTGLPEDHPLRPHVVFAARR